MLVRVQRTNRPIGGIDMDAMLNELHLLRLTLEITTVVLAVGIGAATVMFAIAMVRE